MMCLLSENTSGESNEECRFSCGFGKYAAHFSFEVKDEDVISPYLTDNEDIWQGDAVEVFLSPDGDLTRYFELEVSPFGVRFFGEVVNSDGKTPRLKKRPPMFEASAERTEEGYVVQIELPYGELGAVLPEKMAFNAFRLDKKADGRQLLYALSPTFCNSFHRPQYFVRAKEQI